jgi:hypothetical protein
VSVTPGYDGSGLGQRAVEPWALFVATLLIGAFVLALVVLVVPERTALWACLDAAGVDSTQVVLVEDVEVVPLDGERRVVTGRIQARHPGLEGFRCVVRDTDQGLVVDAVSPPL